MFDSSLFLFDPDCHVRAGPRAGRAADACFGDCYLSGVIALGVELGFGKGQHTLGTCPYAQAAALADNLIDCDLYHDFTSFPFMILLLNKLKTVT
jgi:hypothetical protein